MSKEVDMLKSQHRKARGEGMPPLGTKRGTWRDSLRNTLKRRVLGLRLLGCRGSKGEFSVPRANADIDGQIARRMGVFGTISRKKKREAYQDSHEYERYMEARAREKAEMMEDIERCHAEREARERKKHAPMA